MRITCTAGGSYAEAIREIVVAIPCPPVGCLEETIGDLHMLGRSIKPAFPS